MNMNDNPGKNSFCVECGTKITSEDAVFCDSCGARLKEAEDTTVQIFHEQPYAAPPDNESVYSQPQYQQPQYQQQQFVRKKKKSKAPLIIGIVAAFLVFCAVAVFVFIRFFMPNDWFNFFDGPPRTQSTPPPDNQSDETPGNNNGDDNNNADSNGDGNNAGQDGQDGQTDINNPPVDVNITYDGNIVDELDIDIYERVLLLAGIDSGDINADIVWDNNNPRVIDLVAAADGQEATIRGVGLGGATLTLTMGSYTKTLDVRVIAPDIEIRDFIIPNSSSTRLSESDIRHLSNAELVIAWNEIFARHGFMFGSKALTEWFEKQPWYEPVYPFGTFNYSLLNRTESNNVTTLRALRDKRNNGGSPYTGTGAPDIWHYQTFWDSGSRHIEYPEIADMGGGLETALHEIYARHGRIFENPRWSQYYKSFTWYEEIIPDHLWDDSILNEFELSNAIMLRLAIGGSTAQDPE